MIYTFVRGANIAADVKVGDAHTWLQMRPNVGGYPGRSGGPPKEITGEVVAVGDTYIKVQAENVGPLNS